MTIHENTASATASACTPQPWRAWTEVHERRPRYPNRQWAARFFVNARAGTIGERTLAHVFGNTPEEALANANLIAAGPELLDACRLAVISMREALDGNSPGWMDNMRADLEFIEKTITKAYGQTI